MKKQQTLISSLNTYSQAFETSNYFSKRFASRNDNQSQVADLKARSNTIYKNWDKKKARIEYWKKKEIDQKVIKTDVNPDENQQDINKQRQLLIEFRDLGKNLFSNRKLAKSQIAVAQSQKLQHQNNQRKILQQKQDREQNKVTTILKETLQEIKPEKNYRRTIDIKKNVVQKCIDENVPSVYHQFNKNLDKLELFQMVDQHYRQSVIQDKDMNTDLQLEYQNHYADNQTRNENLQLKKNKSSNQYLVMQIEDQLLPVKKIVPDRSLKKLLGIENWENDQQNNLNSNEINQASADGLPISLKDYNWVYQDKIQPTKSNERLHKNLSNLEQQIEGQLPHNPMLSFQQLDKTKNQKGIDETREKLKNLKERIQSQKDKKPMFREVLHSGYWKYKSKHFDDSSTNIYGTFQQDDNDIKPFTITTESNSIPELASLNLFRSQELQNEKRTQNLSNTRYHHQGSKALNNDSPKMLKSLPNIKNNKGNSIIMQNQNIRDILQKQQIKQNLVNESISKNWIKGRNNRSLKE
ncbi:UNKNOWN [Stylonychia lemnae]|uniref:Uncharacterized protein n=1 Tax=Stylonychia lemnae TaxID=5949 RepID=A0A077ZPH3_STYLE|nr:UNKNOWN [Stylonychia lemnae]|eukprot:CDW71872.1 UNKNOWN [Stylonychia lemnae]